MSHQLSKHLFLGQRLTASAIVLLLVAFMASSVVAHATAGAALHPQQPSTDSAIAAPTPAPRSAPLSPPAGNLDPTFGSGGKVTTDFGGYGYDYANAVAIQNDGKTVAVGYAVIGDDAAFAVARYNSDGTLDTTFGSGGMVTTDFERGPDYAHAVVIQSDGKIVAAGYASRSDYVHDFDFALARYNSDGTLDTVFGNGGLVTTDFGYWRDTAYAMAIQSDGKFVVGGYTKVGDNYYDDFALARYNSDGALDISFGNGGQVTTDFEGYDDQAYAVTIQSNGKIVVAGYKMVGNNYDYDFALARYNSNGSLDTSFGNGGQVTTDFEGQYDQAYAVTIQSDGKIVAAGYAIGDDYDFALARYNSDGTLDTTFGSSGQVTTNFGEYDIARAVAIQSNGQIVAAGSAEVVYFNAAFALARYNSDGTLDSSFGSGGQVTTDVGIEKDEALAVAIRTDGKIVAVGYAEQMGNSDFTLTRYNNDGTLDTTFGNLGKVTTNFGRGYDWAHTMAIQSDGKIVAVGYSRFGINRDFALARYNSNGALDASFGHRGLVTTGLGSFHDEAFAVAIQSDGKIVAAGTTEIDYQYDFVLTRYNSHGTLDDSFGRFGMVRTDFGNGDDQANAVAIQSDGKIIAAGYESNGSDSGFALARFNSDGSLDTSFGSAGKVTTNFGSGDDKTYDLAIQSDGKIVVAGYASNGNNLDFALARYNGDGSLDTSFGNNGKVTTDFGSLYDEASSVTIQSDGNIVAAGRAYIGGLNDFGLARYNRDGSLDTSFGSGGKVTTDFDGSNNEAHAMTIQSDGKIVAAGFAGISNNADFALARYNSDGTLDTSFANGGKVKTSFGSGSDSAHAVAFQSDGKIVTAGSTGIGGIYDFALARYRVASTGSQAIADGASATLEGVTITNHSGVPCDLTVTRHPIPPGGAPADLGELPVLWQLSTTCPSYNFDLVFSYTDTELLFGNNVSEARFQAYRAPDMNGPFSPVDSVVNTDANTVTVTGVTQLSWWGLIGRGPQLYLPLVLHQ